MNKQTRELVIQILAQLIRQQVNADAEPVALRVITKYEHLFDKPTGIIGGQIQFAFKCDDLLKFAEEQRKKFKM